LREEKLLFCRITQITALRLLTTPAIMGSDVKKMHEAWGLWDRVCADDGIEFVPEPESIEQEFDRLSATQSSSPKVWVGGCLPAGLCPGGRAKACNL
jgi:hypothetical protein